MSSDIGIESIDHDPEEERYRVTYRRETPPSVAVPAAMKEITDEETWELQPLHAVIDPDALDELFQPPKAVETRGPDRVTFAYQNHVVTVFSDQRFVIRAANDQKPDSSPVR